MKKGVLILGNGFDLDLGLKTSYSDFMDSDNFKAIADNNNFAYYLQSKRAIIGDNWIDIENEIKEYLNIPQNNFYKDMLKSSSFEQDYYNIITALTSYLSNIDYSSIDLTSSAAKILKSVIINGYFDILSFNYTDLTKIASQLHFTKHMIASKRINAKSFVNHIHGSVKDNNIILGVEDEATIEDDYCYVIKSMSPHFKSNNVREALANSDIIIFFGHSLGETDYLYFNEFFSLQSRVNNQNPNNKYIRLFTKNESSRLDLMKRLRKMNKKQISLLIDSDNFKVYRTESDSDEIIEVINYLKNNSKEIDENNNQEMIRQLERFIVG